MPCLIWFSTTAKREKEESKERNYLVKSSIRRVFLIKKKKKALN